MNAAYMAAVKLKEQGYYFFLSFIFNIFDTIVC